MSLSLSLCLVVVAVACGSGCSGSSSETADGGVASPDALVELEPDAKAPLCGDGELDPGEACDDANTADADGCTSDCTAVEVGHACGSPGDPCVVTHVCGNGLVEDDEACDDHNTTDSDGCRGDCAMVDAGWTCDPAGIRCSAAACGDGIVAGNEECDDHAAATPGCSATCTLEAGYQCVIAGAACTATVCGNLVTEGTEQCDDMNNDLGDGCTPLCMREPQCTNGTCVDICGDGAIQAGEACDDGNLQNFDGCSSTCTVEFGFACVASTSVEPTTLHVPVVYRDFKGKDYGTAGHVDFENVNKSQANMTKVALDANKKPELRTNPTVDFDATGHNSIKNQTTFALWYRDSPLAKTVATTLPMTRIAAGTYEFDSQAFFPLDGEGWQASTVPAAAKEASRTNGHNFSFTSELRYWFKWGGTEQLTFRGDDDVWVYVNGKLAVDLGGVHSAAVASITLSETFNTTQGLGMVLDGTYEVVVFQAERHTDASSYKLTLKGFNTQKSVCDDTCGDGKTSSHEQCDDGVNDGSYGHCGAGCTFGPRCGDGLLQGTEACDDGTSMNTGGYGKCKPTCELGPRCGDGVIQYGKGETCDDGNTVGGDTCPADCVGIIL